ncbi:hypothetical protein ACOCJ4_08760 [Knoellia sp. CPCC 206435]|uniref:hypothetical protein n=1 Tax=Knoellia terrae TaxID=3404797 RepID=UPI003B43C468
MDADARLDAAVGSVAEEATRLLEALGRTSASSMKDPTDEEEDLEHAHVAMGDGETCTWCPVCRSVGVLRSVSPETLSRLADLAGAAATVLADLATRHTEEGAHGRGEPADRTTRTEPIPVVDEEELS